MGSLDMDERVWRKEMMKIQPLGTLMVKGSKMAKRNGKVSNLVRSIQNCVLELGSVSFRLNERRLNKHGEQLRKTPDLNSCPPCSTCTNPLQILCTLTRGR